ncbi:MAG: DUF1919 domain-containing protein [Mobilitalea sp.]
MIKYYELSGTIDVIGITSNITVFNKINGFSYLPKASLPKIDFDIIIIMAENKAFIEIASEAAALGIPNEKLISYRVFTLPNFNLQTYLEIRESKPTIFSNNCWGGITYHHLKLEFTSPLINMYENSRDYIKLLKNPEKYMNSKLTLKEECYEPTLKRNYPICYCDDILLHFNHDTSFEEANESWERRKKRINWNNLFVMMYTESEEIAMEFAKLPYERKICFVPFPSSEKSLVYVDFCNKNEMADIPFWKIVNGMAADIYPYYDILELLSHGNISKISTIE